MKHTMNNDRLIPIAENTGPIAEGHVHVSRQYNPITVKTIVSIRTIMASGHKTG
jgi:vacuolar-type H+-ATPase subunit B/Vma2